MASPSRASFWTRHSGDDHKRRLLASLPSAKLRKGLRGESHGKEALRLGGRLFRADQLADAVRLPLLLRMTSTRHSGEVGVVHHDGTIEIKPVQRRFVEKSEMNPGRMSRLPVNWGVFAGMVGSSSYIIQYRTSRAICHRSGHWTRLGTISRLAAGDLLIEPRSQIGLGKRRPRIVAYGF